MSYIKNTVASVAMLFTSVVLTSCNVFQVEGVCDSTEIRKANYFFQQVLPKYEAGSIKGDGVMIKHYIGEMYFLRAYQYFNKLVSLVDFPMECCH